MRFRNENGVILIDILIVILIAGIIAAIVVPQYAEKKAKEQMELSRQNLIALADAEDRYFEEMGKYAPDKEELATVVPEVGGVVSPGGEEYAFELPDSLSYIIICPLGHGEVRADTTQRRFSWEK